MRLRSPTPMPASSRAAPIASAWPGKPASTSVLPFCSSTIKVRLRKLSGSFGLLGIGRTYTPLATLIVHLLGRSSNCRYSTYYPAAAVGPIYAEGLATHTSSARRGSGGTASARRNTICSFQTSPTERSSLPSSSLLVDRTVTSSKIGRGSGQNASEATAPLLQGASPIAGDGHFVSSSSFLTLLPLFMMILRFFSSCSTDMSSRGLPSTTSRSASLPSSMVPI